MLVARLWHREGLEREVLGKAREALCLQVHSVPAAAPSCPSASAVRRGVYPVGPHTQMCPQTLVQASCTSSLTGLLG